nr:hypothetical protein [Tanacetum cinerariifolium]
MEEINNFQQEPDENIYQAWDRFKELLMKCPQHYLTEIHETAADAKIAIQEKAENSQKWHNGTSKSRNTETSNGLAAIQAQLNNLGREIKKVNEKSMLLKLDVNNAKDPITPNISHSKKKGRPLRKHTTRNFERGFGSLPSSTEANPRDQVKLISTTIEADSCSIRQAYAEASQSIPQKEKDPGSFTLPCFINNVFFDNAFVDLGASISVIPLLTYLNLGLGKLTHTKLTIKLADRTVKYPKGIAENVLVRIARAKIDVYKRKITLRVGEEKIVFTSVKPASSLIKRVHMLSLRERMELDLEYRLMGENLVLNRLLDPLFKDSIELNDLNEPVELRRNQGDDLKPTVKEGEVIEEFRTRDEDLDTGIDDYPSYCNYDKKIHIDFLENMDAYCDEGMGDIIVAEPFLREVGTKTRRFKGMITIYNGNNEVTYQMVRSHPRFKRHTNEQCNKIPPLLKVSNEDKMNGISIRGCCHVGLGTQHMGRSGELFWYYSGGVRFTYLAPGLLSLTFDGFGFDLWAKLVPELKIFDKLTRGLPPLFKLKQASSKRKKQAGKKERKALKDQ